MKILYSENADDVIFGAPPTYYHLSFSPNGYILLWEGDNWTINGVTREGSYDFAPTKYPLTEPADTAYTQLLADPAAFLMELHL